MQIARHPACSLLVASALFLTPTLWADTAFTLFDGELRQLNLLTGETTPVGPTGLRHPGPMTTAPGGELFVLDLGIDHLTLFLAVIDPLTGAGIHLGNLGARIDRPLGLAFTAPDELWLLGDHSLYRLDPLAGAATLVSRVSPDLLQIASRGSQLLGLFAGREGLEVVHVDGDSGALDPIADLDIPIAGLELAFEANGRRAWIRRTQDIPIAPPFIVEEMYRVDVGSWKSELTFSQESLFRASNGLALLAGPVDVPTLSPLALLLLGLLMGVMALYTLRRMQKKAPRKTAVGWILILLSLSLGPAARAQTAFSFLDDVLQQVELETGERRALGPTGLSRPSLLAAAPDGQLFALDRTVERTTFLLMAIDPTTRAVEPRGNVGVAIQRPLGLTITSDGTLWLLADRNLYQLDPQNGAATQIASVSGDLTQIAARGRGLFGLVTENDLVEVVRIDPPSGELSKIAVLDIEPGRLHLVFGSGGQRAWILRVVGFLIAPPFVTEQLFQLDTGTWKSELVSHRDGTFTTLEGLAMATSPVVVPTLSPVAMICLALLLAAAASTLLRRIRF